MNRRRFLLLAVGMIVGGGVSAGAWLRRSFDQHIAEEIDALLAEVIPTPARIVNDSDLDELPDPVQRWLRASGVPGTPIPSVVRLTQHGEFRLGADKGWMPMHATEYYTTNPPGFLWKASMEMFPLVQVSGRDRYFQGTGDIEMRVASIIPVAAKAGGNLDRGALLRYLNETMWFPAVLVLPHVMWDAIDDSRARATLTDAGQSVSAIFQFGADGRLVNMTADRWNDSERAVLPWSTPITDWGTFNGIELASSGTGIWKTGADAYEYIRLRLTSVEYDPQ